MNAGIADPEVRKKNLGKKNHRMWNGKLWASQLVAQWWQDTAKRSGDEVVDLMHLFLVSFEINSVKISRKEAQCGIGKWAFGDVCNLAAFVPHALRRTSHRIARIHGLLVLFEDPIIKSYWMIHSETPCLLVCPGQLETKAIIGMFFQVRIREGLLKLKTEPCALRTAFWVRTNDFHKFHKVSADVPEYLWSENGSSKSHRGVLCLTHVARTASLDLHGATGPITQIRHCVLSRANWASLGKISKTSKRDNTMIHLQKFPALVHVRFKLCNGLLHRGPPVFGNYNLEF